MKRNKDIDLSGTLLYLKEHTQEMKLLRWTIILGMVFGVLILGWLILTHRIAYPIAILRQYVAKC